MKRIRIWMSLAAVVLWPAVTQAQEEEGGPTTLLLRPAGEPSPALKYQILPARQELKPGNAVIFYHRAMQMMQSSRSAMLLQDRAEGKTSVIQFEDNIANWITIPLNEVPLLEARGELAPYASALNEVFLGARRQDCDWGFNDRPETIDLLLPDVQESRSLARLVALKVRVEMLDGNIEEALSWLQTGYALARHVSQGPTIIQSLVGVAITGVMNRQLEELIQVEGGPNLYWALASRPQPFIDLEPALEGERTLLERMLPGLRDLDGAPWSLERGRQFAGELQEVLSQLSGSGAMIVKGDAGESTPPLGPRLALAVLVARSYPQARQSLIDSGMPESEIEAMPTIQVVGLVAYRQYRALSDDLYKWMSLPYWQSYEGVNAVQQGWTMEDKLSNPGVLIFTLLVPALNSVRVAEVRTDRQLAALQTIEAIRLAVAEQGTLPESLNALSVPAPLDPATGKPFDYTVDGDAATLTAPMIPGAWDDRSNRVHYMLKLK